MVDIVDLKKNNVVVYPKTHMEAVVDLVHATPTSKGLLSALDKEKLDKLSLPRGGAENTIPLHTKVPLYSTYYFSTANKMLIRKEDGWYTLVDNVFVTKGSV